MEKSTERTSKMQSAIVIRTLVPMLLMSIIIAIAVFVSYKASVKKEISESLAGVAVTVAEAYDRMYPGEYEIVGEGNVSLYKGEHELTGEFEVIDEVKAKTGIDITLVNGNTRILTTLKSAKGERYVPTAINAAIYKNAETSKEVMYYTVDIDGVAYYACYLPIYNGNVYAGLIAAAKPVHDIDREAGRAAIPIVITTILAMLLAFALIYAYIHPVVISMDKICSFLNGMKDGNLNNEMPRSVTGRKDELGKTGKAVVDMQRAIRILVERDPLTNLYNRRYGGAKLRNIQKLAIRSGMPYALAIGDIDFFKKVNDTYGHAAGDAVLKSVAEIMRNHMTGKGFIARWGGEEFLLVFEKQNQDEAQKELNDILNKIRAMKLEYNDLTICVTMSFGVIGGDDTEDYSHLLKQADARLYVAKTNGRNQVVALDEDEYKEKHEEAVASEESAAVPAEEAADTAVNAAEADSENANTIVDKMTDGILREVEDKQ